MTTRPIVLAALIVLGTVAQIWAQSDDGQVRPRVNTGMHGAAAGAAAPDPASVIVPETLSGPALFGQLAFEQSCAVCHGANGAGGTGVAPPLIHPIYEPGHHPDTAFQRAAASGVRSHHWNFGDMPPVEGVTPREVALIAAYIREIQRANGIE